MLGVYLVKRMSAETFADVVKSSPRRIREMLFARLGIKAKKKGIGLKVGAKQAERTQKLHDRLRQSGSQNEDELCIELVRNWLYTQRPLLKSTLDHLGVANDDGLIEEETNFFEELEEEKVKDLVAHLQGASFTDEHIEVYLRFMKVPHLDGLFGTLEAA